MTEGNVAPLTVKLSPRMKAALLVAISERYTSVSEGIRGILSDWLREVESKEAKDDGC